jgi:hypothetical protein
MNVTKETLGTRVRHSNRAAEPECEQTRVHLQADVFSCSEGATDAAEHEPHFVNRKAEAGCDLDLVLV